MYLPRSSGQISQHKEEYGNSQKRIAVIVLFFTMILSGVSFLAPSNIIAQEVHGRQASSQQERISFRVVSWNIENLFDTHHDSLKNDHEYLPDAIRHWNYSRYRQTRPISDGFRKNNVNYWAFREIRSIIPHL